MTSNTAAEIERLVQTLAKALVDNPDQVRTNTLESGKMVVVELTVAAGEVGKVVGRDGRMALALRTLVTAVATKLQRKAMVQILDR